MADTLLYKVTVKVEQTFTATTHNQAEQRAKDLADTLRTVLPGDYRTKHTWWFEPVPNDVAE